MILFENTLINTHKIICVEIVRLGAWKRLEINFTDDTALLLGDYPTEDEAIAKLKELQEKINGKSEEIKNPYEPGNYRTTFFSNYHSNDKS